MTTDAGGQEAWRHKRASDAPLVGVALRLMRARLDRRLRQRDVAAAVGVHTDTVAKWEAGRTPPLIRHWTAIIRFLGYVPFPRPESVAEELLAYRRLTGISQESLARSLDVDPATISRWESGDQVPMEECRARFRTLSQPVLAKAPWNR